MTCKMSFACDKSSSCMNYLYEVVFQTQPILYLPYLENITVRVIWDNKRYWIVIISSFYSNYAAIGPKRVIQIQSNPKTRLRQKQP